MRKIVVLLISAIGLGLVYAVGLAAGLPGESIRAETVGPGRAESEGLSILASQPVTTTFTYQGLLTDGGGPADGLYDFELLLFDDPLMGSQVGVTVTLEDVGVMAGLFTAELNFGDVFDGRTLWLEIRVRPGGDTGAYTTLSPRQALTPAPYAHSLRPGATISGTVSFPIPAVLGGGPQGVLNLNNSSGNGLYVFSAQTGITVDSAYTGLEVSYAENDGIQVRQPGGAGVYVHEPEGNGVYVLAAGGYGVYASSTSAADYGGYFLNTATGGSGLYAEGTDVPVPPNFSIPIPDLTLGGSTGMLVSDPDDASSSLSLVSRDNVQIRLDADDSEDSIFAIYNGANQLVFSVDESGNVSGPAGGSTLAEAGENGPVKLYAMESPENWFEDFGTAALDGGEATVAIEPLFAATVNLDRDYHVFLTPLGDCALYVAEKTPAAFTVRAQGGAACAIEFDYRIVARRRGYEDLRLEPVDLDALAGGE